MAPEQVLGQPIDGRADLFALGVMLWELLTWRPLFARPTAQEIAAMVVGGEVPRPSSLRSEVPPALDAVVMRALERDPRRRHASAGELARELGPFGLPRGDLARALGQLVRAVESRRAKARGPGIDRRRVTPASPPQGVAAVPTPPALAPVPTPGPSLRARLPTPDGLLPPAPGVAVAPMPLPMPLPLIPDTPAAGWASRLLWTVVVATAAFLAGAQWARTTGSVTTGNTADAHLPTRTNVIQPLIPSAEVRPR